MNFCPRCSECNHCSVGCEYAVTATREGGKVEVMSQQKRVVMLRTKKGNPLVTVISRRRQGPKSSSPARSHKAPKWGQASLGDGDATGKRIPGLSRKFYCPKCGNAMPKRTAKQSCARVRSHRQLVEGIINGMKESTDAIKLTEAPPAGQQQLINVLVGMMTTTEQIVQLLLNAEDVTPAHVAEVHNAAAQAIDGLLTLSDVVAGLVVEQGLTGEVDA